MPTPRFARFLQALLVFTSCALPALSAVQIIDLGVVAGDITSYPTAINNAGQVAGFTTGALDTHAFFYSNGVMTLIPTSGTQSRAFAINGAGEVVGTDGQNAFLFSNGVLHNLGSLGGGVAEAHGINNTGEIVGGAVVLPAGVVHPFVYRDGKMIEMQPPAGHGRYTLASGVNDAGQIVGLSYQLYGPPQAFVDNGEGPVTITANIGNSNTQAFAINQLGQIAGVATAANSFQHAFLYTNGQMADLGLLPGMLHSEASAMNDFGEVVGVSWHGVIDHAFLFRNGTMIDLNTLLPENSGWTLEGATAINDAEQIVGYGIHNGQGRAYLLSTNLASPLWKYNFTIITDTVGSDPFRYGVASTPRAISQLHNQATGSFTPSCQCRASYMYRNGNLTTDASDYIPLFPGLGRALFNAVSSAGIFVGQTLQGLPFAYPIEGLPTTLANQQGIAWDVNDSRLIVGVLYNGPNQTDPSGFLWNAGQITSLDSFLPQFINGTGAMLGTMSGSVALYSNSAATVVGNPPGTYSSLALKAFSDTGNFLVSTSGAPSASYLYKTGAYQQLPSGFSAAGINSSGNMVGDLASVPVIYVNGASTPLANLIEGISGWPQGATLSDVVAINNAGQILARVTYQGNVFGDQISAILTPIPNIP